MPYIPKSDRARLQKIADELHVFYAEGLTAGETTFVFYTMLKKLTCKEDGTLQSFHAASRVLGVLEAVKLEFYRRVVAPYEEAKMKENGDVE